MNSITVAKVYQLKRKLGAGAFGEIFLAINLKTNAQVAVKCESCTLKTPQLYYEAKILNFLNNDETVDRGIPHNYMCTTEGEYNFMVMDLLGQSLEDIFGSCNRKFQLKSVMIMGYQMLERLEFVHSKNFIHRDVKPDNFLVGVGKNSSRIYLIDFGLAKKYMTKEQVHIPYKDNKNLTGTARYASLNTHLGIEQGRRDDIEGLANVLIYFLKGGLPWQNLRANSKKERYEKIMEKKLVTPIEVLCRGLPEEMMEFFTYSRSIQFEEKPDYKKLKELLLRVMQREGVKPDSEIEWGCDITVRKQQPS